MAIKDLTRARKTYSYYRSTPIVETTAAPVAAEVLPVKALIQFNRYFGDGPRYVIGRKVPAGLDVTITSSAAGHVQIAYPAVVDLTSADALMTPRGTSPLETSVSFGDGIDMFMKNDAGVATDSDFTVVFY